MEIIRGSTPDIVVSIPEDIIDLASEVEDVWVTFWSSGTDDITKKYSDGDVEIDAENLTLTCTLTQEETLSIKGDTGGAQVKILTDGGKVLVSDQTEFDVLPVRNKEVM